MANQPIDNSEWPSMDSVQCDTGCGQWIIIDHEYTGPRYCGTCLAQRTGGGNGLTITQPANWSSVNNPPPPEPVYPPRTNPITIRVFDPDVTARCLLHRLDDPVGEIRLMSTDPVDIAIAYTIHDHLWHRSDAWLIGGPGGADGDVCNPCGGGSKDKTPLIDGPRHDLCLKGNPRGGWGRNCPCTHDRPHMRGIKPGHRDTPGAVARMQKILDVHRPNPEAAPGRAGPVYITNYLFDPEEEEGDGEV